MKTKIKNKKFKTCCRLQWEVQNLKCIQQCIVGVIFGLFFLPLSALALVDVKVSDTIAGYSSAIKATTENPGEKITIRVEKPDGGVINITENADDFGEVKTEFLGFHTKKIGEYEVRAFPKGKNFVDFPPKTFVVYPDKTSPIHSRVRVENDSIAANGSEEAKIRVQLKDRHGNAIQNHFVELISSNADDDIIDISNDSRTNEFGEVVFKITSEEPGISYYTAIDKNANVTLEERTKIVFYEVDTRKQKDEKGNEDSIFSPKYFSADIFGPEYDDDVAADEDDGDFGPVDYFDIEFPEEVRVGSKITSLKIIARDKNGKVAKNYTGTIIIATPRDDYAELPNDGMYTFKQKDQGVRQFDLAFTFGTQGTQKIVVTGFDEEEGFTAERGEIEIEVLERCATGDDACKDPNAEDDGGSDVSDSIEIIAPKDNYASADRTVNIMGKARPNTNLIIFVDGEEEGKIEVGADGNFFGEAGGILDGQHVLYLQESEGSEERSDSVKFLIDKTAPTFDEIDIYPSGKIKTGEIFTLTVVSEPKLSSTVRFAGNQETLVEDEEIAGKYTLNLRAPEEPGNFDLSITIRDQLDNLSSEAIKMQIIKEGDQLPFPVGVSAKGENGRAIINWGPLNISDDRLAKYRIFYGTNEISLHPATEVSADETEAIVEDLSNGQRYYFKVAGVDVYGVEGEKSKTVFVTPEGNTAEVYGPIRVQALGENGVVTLKWRDTGNQEVTQYLVFMGEQESALMLNTQVPKGTTEVSIPNVQNGVRYFFTIAEVNGEGKELKRSDVVSVVPEEVHESAPVDDTDDEVVGDVETPVVGNTLNATPRSGEVQLEWSKPSQLTAFFDIRFGIGPDNFQERFTVSGLKSEVAVPDLINNVPYYFTVVPLDENGIPLAGVEYNTVQAIPSFSGVHKNALFVPIPQLMDVESHVENGPEVMFLFLIATSFAFMMFSFHRSFSGMRVSRC